MATAAASLKKGILGTWKKSPAIYVNKQKIALHEPKKLYVLPDARIKSTFIK